MQIGKHFLHPYAEIADMVQQTSPQERKPILIRNADRFAQKIDKNAFKQVQYPANVTILPNILHNFLWAPLCNLFQNTPMRQVFTVKP